MLWRSELQRESQQLVQYIIHASHVAHCICFIFSDETAQQQVMSTVTAPVQMFIANCFINAVLLESHQVSTVNFVSRLHKNIKMSGTAKKSLDYFTPFEFI